MKKDIRHLFDEFLYECEFFRKLSPQTLRTYRLRGELFFRLMPEIDLQILTHHTIMRFFKLLQERRRVVGKRMKTGIAASTITRYRSCLNSFFEWLINQKLLAENPFKHIKYIAPTYEDKQFLNKEQVERIITAIYTLHAKNLFILKRNLALFYVLIFCGLRRGELLKLQIRDIDFERKFITVRAETSKSKRTRTIPMHSLVILRLKDYLKERLKYKAPQVFVSGMRDAALTEQGLKRLISTLCQRSGVSFHLYQFRHTFAVNFLKMSNNLVKLKELLGHRNINVTMTYLRCIPATEMRADVEAMDIDEFV